MLDAELRGKVAPEIARLEDLLTSTVFGILKFIPPRVFWPEAMRRAIRLDGVSLRDLVAREWAPFDTFTHLRIRFWPRHPKWGEPDLLVAFSADGGPQLCIVFETKLEAGKSSLGEQDQLIRYLNLLDDQAWINTNLGVRGPIASPGLVYVTPRQSWSDLEDSVATAQNPQQARGRLFLLQWQDILVAASTDAETAPSPFKRMLTDVSGFLRHRELAFFGGFTRMPLDVDFDSELPRFWATGQFRGFDELPLEFHPRKEVDERN